MATAVSPVGGGKLSSENKCDFDLNSWTRSPGSIPTIAADKGRGANLLAVWAAKAKIGYIAEEKGDDRT